MIYRNVLIHYTGPGWYKSSDFRHILGGRVPGSGRRIRADLNDHLADIVAGEEADQGLGGVFQSVDYRLSPGNPAVADPLAEENLLKAAGRGMFFMRSFMDEVSYGFPARGGTVVKLLKRLPA